MLKRILVGLGDVEHSARAVRQAIDLCKLHEAELTAVTVVDHRSLENVGPVPLGGGAAAKELREHRLKLARDVIEKTISQCERQCEEAGMAFRLVLEEGKPLDAVCSHARFHDLMILGREETLFEHGVIAEPADELARLVREGVRPILIVPHEPKECRRAVLAYNGSMGSAKTIRQFIQLRPWPDLEMRLVYFGSSADDAQRELDEAEAYCRAHGYDVQAEFHAGSATEGLLPLADQWDADLLVIGNSARNIVMRKLFGETTLRVIRNARQAVFMSQ
jgi:nucleotide-binding universal stress UspA family protein